MTREDVAFDSSGLRCAARLYLPDGDPPHACVVMAHGFSGVRDQRLDAYAERFAGAGLAVLLFDYRHFGDSEGEPRQRLDVRRQLEDWHAAIRHARSVDRVDPERIGLWGTSFSGGHVIEVASTDPRVRAVVSQVPFTTGVAALRSAGLAQNARMTAAGLRDLLRAALGRPPAYIPAVGPPGSTAAMTAPDALPGMAGLTPEGTTWMNRFTPRMLLPLALYRPYAKLPALRCPVLVMVADEDALTPPQPALRAVRRSPGADLVRYPIEHFDIYLGEWFDRAVDEQTHFLTRHLRPAPAPSPPPPDPRDRAGSPP